MNASMIHFLIHSHCCACCSYLTCAPLDDQFFFCSFCIFHFFLVIFHFVETLTSIELCMCVSVCVCVYDFSIESFIIVIVDDACNFENRFFYTRTTVHAENEFEIFVLDKRFVFQPLYDWSVPLRIVVDFDNRAVYRTYTHMDCTHIESQDRKDNFSRLYPMGNPFEMNCAVPTHTYAHIYMCIL